MVLQRQMAGEIEQTETAKAFRERFQCKSTLESTRVLESFGDSLGGLLGREKGEIPGQKKKE